MHEGRDGQITMERVKTTGPARASVMQRQLKDKKCSTTQGENEKREGEKASLMS